jgi:hypothetical protein
VLGSGPHHGGTAAVGYHFPPGSTRWWPPRLPPPPPPPPLPRRYQWPQHRWQAVSATIILRGHDFPHSSCIHSCWVPRAHLAWRADPGQDGAWRADPLFAPQAVKVMAGVSSIVFQIAPNALVTSPTPIFSPSAAAAISSAECCPGCPCARDQGSRPAAVASKPARRLATRAYVRAMRAGGGQLARRCAAGPAVALVAGAAKVQVQLRCRRS